MNIGFVCHEYPPTPHGGIGTMTQVLSRALTEAGHRVRVVGVYGAGACLPEHEDDRGVKVWRLRRPRGRFGWIVARAMVFRLVRRWISLGEIDLVEVPDWQGWAAGWPALKAPVICRLNGSDSYFCAEMGREPRPMARLIEGASLRRADFWCAVSRYTADKTQDLFRLSTGPSAILHNSVELPAAPTEERSRRRVVFSGTLTPKKGVLSLLKAWPEVMGSCPQAELHVFGKDGQLEDGRSMQSVLEAAIPAAIRSSVIFHGHVTREQLLAALVTARAAAFPSYAEALPLAPLEAMARGCPTIASSRGSGPEVIRHGRDGLLVDPDQPPEIASALIRLLTDDSLAASLGVAGRNRVGSTFSVDGCVEQNLSFYQSCLDTFHRTAQTALPSKESWRDA